MGSIALLLIFWLVVMGVVVFWITQFNHLMSLPDASFPGRYDKLIWAGLLIALNILGALTFWLFKTSKPKP